MVKPVILIIAAIPAIFAIMISIPMLTQTEIPYSAANSSDSISIDYTRHHLQTVSFGVTEHIGAVKTEILTIANDGAAVYTLIQDGQFEPEKKFNVDKQTMRKLTAFIKETGIISIPTESFPVKDNVTQYKKSTLHITLNGHDKKISWPEQNATQIFIPPIITQFELELDAVFNTGK